MNILFLFTSCILFGVIGMIFGSVGSILGFIFGGFLVVLTELKGMRNDIDELSEKVFCKDKKVD